QVVGHLPEWMATTPGLEHAAITTLTPLVLQMSIGDGNRFPSSGPSACLLNSCNKKIKKKNRVLTILMHSETPHTFLRLILNIESIPRSGRAEVEPHRRCLLERAASGLNASAPTESGSPQSPVSLKQPSAAIQLVLFHFLHPPDSVFSIFFNCTEIRPSTVLLYV
ncbi:hypothetical protein K1T71_012560, partial [Dendrolimus kikuchii]